MCGIVGFWDTQQRSAKEKLQEAVMLMNDALLHRGPDGASNWIDSNLGIALAHRRLAVVDLSASGSQPMISASGRYVISYNGEIYNYLAIKQQLELSGTKPSWRGHSDTEVILAAFETWGIENALQQFVGMFAIALWDRQQQALFLIRDRLGEKPLYYGWCKEYLLFGSELKALQKHPAWQANIDKDSVKLLLQYNCIPAPYTIYENIYKLEPGCILTVYPNKTSIKNAYWQLHEVINKPVIDKITNAKLATDLLEEKLSATIKLQMLADVAVGTFLSGGIDSATVTAIMQANSNKPIKTFTIGFNEADYNEAKQARAIANHLGTQHTELYLSDLDAMQVIPHLANFYDEPFADSSQLPTYMVAKLAKESVTVSLSGDGGDELFAGYNRYKQINNIWRLLQPLPVLVRKNIAKLLLSISPKYWDNILAPFKFMLPGIMYRNTGDKIHKMANIIGLESPTKIYQKLLTHWENDAHNLLPDLSKDLPKASLTQTMMYIDTKRYLPDDILVKLDRAAMAVSLETRVPFLDHRLVEFAWSLPLEYKIRDGQSKWLLRQVLNRYLPKQLYETPKMGFGVPLAQWLRGPMQEWAGDLLSSSMLKKHDFLDADVIKNKWHEHLSGKRNWQYQLWDVLMFQSWYEVYHG